MSGKVMLAERLKGEQIDTRLLRRNYRDDVPLSPGHAVVTLCDEVDRQRKWRRQVAEWLNKLHGDGCTMDPCDCRVRDAKKDLRL